jgi:hypothetical protein
VAEFKSTSKPDPPQAGGSLSLLGNYWAVGIANFSYRIEAARLNYPWEMTNAKCEMPRTGRERCDRAAIGLTSPFPRDFHNAVLGWRYGLPERSGFLCRRPNLLYWSVRAASANWR